VLLVDGAVLGLERNVGSRPGRRTHVSRALEVGVDGYGEKRGGKG